MFRLDLRRGDAAAVPAPDASDDTALVHGFRRGFYGGFYRPYYSFYRPYYYPRVYSSFSFYYSAPYFRYGYYRPYVYSYYYAPPVYYYSAPYYYCPISDTAPTMPYATTLGLRAGYTAPQSAPDAVTAPAPLPPADGTYPYDGGPANPVPQPSARPAAPATPPVPLEGRPVSLPAPEKKYTYPAYGEGKTSFAQDRVAPPALSR